MSDTRSPKRGGVARGGAFFAGIAAVAAAFAVWQWLQPSDAARAVEDGADKWVSGTAPETAPPPRPRAAAAFSRALTLGRFEASDGVDPADHPVLADVIEWRALVDRGAGDWDRVRAFLERRPEWPERMALRRRAEETMPEGLDVAARLAFFAHREPMTARGARLYGEALIATGRRALGEAWIARAWRDDRMGRYEEGLFLANHPALVEPLIELRYERMLWLDRTGAARRLAGSLDEGFDLLARARATLMRGGGGVDQLIGQLPEALQSHPALTHARMEWRARRGRTEETETMILEASAAGRLGQPSAWAKRRMILARDAHEQGRFEDAYALAAGHGLRHGARFAELEWYAGWIALRRLDRPGTALGHFERLWEGVFWPVSRGRAAYWAARAAAAAGDAETAALWRRRAAQYPHVFYGQLAIGAGVTLPEGPRDGARWDAEDVAMERAAAALYQAGEVQLARRFTERLAERRRSVVGVRRVADINRRWDDLWGAILVGGVAYAKNIPVWSALYPIPNAPSFFGHGVEPALLLGVARQESRFSASAVSPAGARGLMQLMPSTARGMSRQLGLSYDPDALLSDQSYNVTLGAAVMAQLLEYYGGSYVLAIAAYNGGAGNVDGWIRRFGDPRDPDVDVVDWIESIPFRETRSYVQRVLEATQVYRARLAPGGVGLTADLNRARRTPATAPVSADPSGAEPAEAGPAGSDPEAPVEGEGADAEGAEGERADATQ